MGSLDEGQCYQDEFEIGSDPCGLQLNGDAREVSETAQIEDAVRVLLQGLGEDVNRDGIIKTPLRVAKALKDGTSGYQMNVNEIVHGALFAESGANKKSGQAGGSGGLVIVRDLDHYSYCESCLLPFEVKCHVGYIPSGQRVVGLSKLSRVSNIFVRRLQSPQRLADEICSALQQSIEPAGVAVMLRCSHIHIPSLESILRKDEYVKECVEVVLSGSGVMEDRKDRSWRDFLSLARFKGLNVDELQSRSSSHWCPSQGLSLGGGVNPAMVNAVSSILESLGEDPSRKELMDTPARYVQWLLNFKNMKFDMKLNGFAGNINLKPVLKQNGGFESSGTLCSELNLPFWSQCEHHLLPFYGVVHVGYFCDGRILDLSITKALLQSIVHFYGLKLQVQERLTRQVAETVAPFLGGDIMVVVEASHTCMISRGIQKFGSSTATIAVLGRFSTNSETRASFLERVSSSSQMSG